MQMRTPRLLILLAATVFGCSPAPEDPLFAFGSLEAPDGTPTAGTIKILRGECSGPWCGGGQPAPGSPTEPQPEPEFLPFTEVEAEEDGSWMLELTRFDATIYTRNGSDQRTFKAVAQPDPSLPPVEVVYRYESGDVDFPPLRQWDARASVTLTPGADAFEVSTAAAPPIPEQELPQFNEALPVETGRTGTYGITFLDAEEQEVWFQPAGETTALPLEALEDFAVAWRVLASHAGVWFAPTLLGGQTYSTVTQTFPTVELPAHAPRVSMSRGMSCAMMAWDLTVAGELTPCPFTDGSLAFVPLPDAPMGLQLTLDAPTTLSRVVLHGVRSGRSGLTIEAFDGTDWHTVQDVSANEEGPDVPPGSSPFLRVNYTLIAEVPTGLGPVQAVRIWAVQDPDNDAYALAAITGAQEISLFGK